MALWSCIVGQQCFSVDFVDGDSVHYDGFFPVEGADGAPLDEVRAAATKLNGADNAAPIAAALEFHAARHWADSVATYYARYG